ncbi:hypothetical protein LTR10_020169 [Elasticomyces elasticus]|uniref:SEC7 domain-containing protein n=1 Tax=Exophiala sideris TaxID=1016849 RepID=A0ABR0JCA7_9EURO|nr:hypothetical protein LTR10_020169 [Elasticomyces elasticus]KAK5031338.1 hypothetical protein LTS07_005073 [Exophiala sideris]KAK5039058.1 hypothetical protein LTR13_004089 [Exophiala sideris]KAK5060943.1 hypothetical protein LTR69_005542 [Exophiala sideris]KAK5183854.1 hypothetical protein LTR44_004136 [Eurotiomycetes sp. CCFEE 6388]
MAYAQYGSPTKPKSPRTHSSKHLAQSVPARQSSASVTSSPSAPQVQSSRQSAGTPSRTYMLSSGTLLADPVSLGHGNDDDDGEDPHDLSFSSKHVLRASMVDNLVMSLDQFSSGMDDVVFTPRNNSYDMDTRARSRGHTFSSSVSSEPELGELRSMPTFPQTVPRVPLRNNMRHNRNMQRLPSIFGEDEDSVRSKRSDAQRAAHPGQVRRKKRNTSTGGRSNASSASSSIDLGHLASLSGRLGPAGDRRSRSFDLGSRNRDPRPSKTPTTNSESVAPTPVIFAGPESQKGMPGDSTVPPIVRKNSAKSSKSAYVKRTWTGTQTANGLRPNHDPVPHLPSMKSAPVLTHATMEQKNYPENLPDPIVTARPGFFRRVFGSSKNPIAPMEYNSHLSNTLTKSYDGRSTPVQDEAPLPSTPLNKVQRPIRRLSTDASANKENQPVISKKSSSFFRRRKKSVSSIVPPPLPLTLNTELKSDTEQADGTSPVSSLRAFMDPYLAEDQLPSHGHRRTNSMQGFYTPTGPPPAFGLPPEQVSLPKAGSHSRNQSYSSNKTLKSHSKTPTLRIPHQQSFLADSSSAEEPFRRSVFGVSQLSDSERSDLRNGREVSDVGLEPTTSANLLASPTPDPRQAAIRQGSWISDTVSPLSGMDEDSGPGPVSHDDEPRSSNKRPKALEMSRKDSESSPLASASDVSDYRSAPTTPVIVETPNEDTPVLSTSYVVPTGPQPLDQNAAKLRAHQIFDNIDDQVDSSNAGAWLGEAGTEQERVRKAYMELFDWSNQDIIESLRGLCDRIALKGETQQVDRVMDAFAQRWCECNPSHFYKSSDVVHTICYSIILLNTDLHLADIGQKMTKTQFVRNTLPTIKRVVHGAERNKTIRPTKSRTNTSSTNDPTLTVQAQGTGQDHLHEPDYVLVEDEATIDIGVGRSWEMQIESVLRSVYSSISQAPLPLFGAPNDSHMHSSQPTNFLTIGSNALRRTPSVLSKAHSDSYRGRFGESRSLGARWISKARSRPRLPSAAGFGSSRTSIDEQSWNGSPSISSTWSKVSLGKTLTTMSVDSFGTEATHGDYQSSIGFANALSQAIIREDQLELDVPVDEGLKASALLEDESLELCGAPWAKEGIVKHKCHLEGVEKRSKDRNWSDCFAVIDKGWMRLFSFSTSAKSLRNKSRLPKAGGVVGGGNWQDNAEEVWKFMLRHTIASSLPPPGYSKARPYVWALSLPTGAVHLFSVGTPDIVKEFVTTANYWSARLSKEPMMGGISNMEYGWSDGVLNYTLIASETPSNARPSTQMSIRSSMDHVNSMRAKLPGDRAHINDWAPPQQSMFASQLLEVDQLKALQTYVNNVEDELQKHNELRSLMLLAFSSKHPNSTKAMNNWEKKSSYLLREIVKFRTYIDCLQNAQSTKERIYKMRKEEDDSRQAEMDSRVLTASEEMA